MWHKLIYTCLYSFNPMQSYHMDDPADITKCEIYQNASSISFRFETRKWGAMGEAGLVSKNWS